MRSNVLIVSSRGRVIRILWRGPFNQTQSVTLNNHMVSVDSRCNVEDHLWVPLLLDISQFSIVISPEVVLPIGIVNPGLSKLEEERFTSKYQLYTYLVDICTRFWRDVSQG